MSLHHSPRIVTDNLVLCLDAGNSRSYPGSGTTWTDLMGTMNGTLTNGPTYDTGAIVFDGIDDYIVSTGTLTSVVATGGNATIEAFVYPTSNGCIYNVGHAGSQYNFGMSIMNGRLRAINSSYDWDLTGSVPFNQWQHLVTVFDSGGANGYRNGTNIGSHASATVTLLTNSNKYYCIGRKAWNYDAEKLTGKIAVLRIYYNKALTQTEISQNFNALRGRFGL